MFYRASRRDLDMTFLSVRHVVLLCLNECAYIPTFQHLVRPLLYFFVPNRRYKILTLRPSTGALNTCSALLERSRRLHRNKYRLYEIDPWLLWIFITKSQVPDGSLSLSMTPSDVERWAAIGQRARTVWLSDPILGNRCYAYTVSPRTTNLAQ